MNSNTPLPKAQPAIDNPSSMGVFKDMNKSIQMKSATAMEKTLEVEAGVSKFNPDRFKVLSILRTPATCLHSLCKLRLRVS